MQIFMEAQKVFVSIVLDKRRQKKNGTYPVKLRVFTNYPRRQVLYPTAFVFSEQDFFAVWESKKIRTEDRPKRNKLLAIENKALELVEGMKNFSFEEFEKFLYKKPSLDSLDVFTHYDDIVRRNTDFGSISTAEKYHLSKKCIQSFLAFKGIKNERLNFGEITISFLEEFRHYCEKYRNMAPATIGIYLRNLRTIYRIGIKKGLVPQEDYPFLKGEGFKIPTSQKVNKALSLDELKTLWDTEPENENQARAKDFWFFSYYAYGMNIRDICELKHTSVEKESFNYERAKTRNTKKMREKKSVPLTPHLRAIIKRQKKTDSEYLFGIIHSDDSPTKTRQKIHQFNKTVNKHFRKFALHAGIDAEFAKQIGTYHARHSFCSVAIQKGKSVALISEILHDGNLKVTQNYINSFPKEYYKDLSNDLAL